MKNRDAFVMALLISWAVSSEAVAQGKQPMTPKTQNTQKSQNTVADATKRMGEYVINKAKGNEQQAQKRSSDPATVTRDSVIHNQPATFGEAFNEFKKQARADYENFRDQANREYADFVRQAWKEFGVMPATPQPEEKEIPPVVMPKQEEEKPVEDQPVPIRLDQVTLPPPTIPQPVPVAPIFEVKQPKETEKTVSFSVYGTGCKVRFSDDERFSLVSCDKNAVADAWIKLSDEAYNNTIRDCLEIRIRKQLSDWAYLKLLKEMAEACLGKGNEATLLMAYIYCQTGYQMRMGIANDKLYLLYASRHMIYDKSYFNVNGSRFYAYDSQERRMNICEVGFPNEQPLSLFINHAQCLDQNLSDVRTLSSTRYPEMEINVRVNKNMIDFYNDYPQSIIDENVMTRWAVYANTPLTETVRDDIYPVLKEKLRGLGQKEAMERLLNFTQTAYYYKRDDDIWGHDRAFFPEETLYYPYCDCEDRSIFLSRLVRDLLGLKCILIFYPRHLAMAVNFTEEVKGDYIMLDNRKFIVCDPTYIGAPVGKTMPRMDNSSAQVILLE